VRQTRMKTATQPTRNHLSVNNLRFQVLHGMEEVIGSIPIRSTNKPTVKSIS
jgi:hypothetical protein